MGENDGSQKEESKVEKKNTKELNRVLGRGDQQSQRKGSCRRTDLVPEKKVKTGREKGISPIK